MDPGLSNAQWIGHGTVFCVNIAMFYLISPILRKLAGPDHEDKIRLFRFLNILFLILHTFALFTLSAHVEYANFVARVGITLMAFYLSLLSYTLASIFSRRKFGTEKTLDDKKIFLETYSSRIIDIVLLVIIGFATVYALIKIWGADSLLETTGIFGIVAAFLAFTSSIWAPDIVSGLIILNTKMLEDGDVVVIDGYPDEYIIHKVSFIYVILYDIRNNHRTLIRNNRFIQSKIDNLSRIASSDGIRKRFKYMIGYPVTNQSRSEERLEALNKFRTKVDKMFQRAFEACCEKDDIKINRHKPFEWSLTCTDNFALEYTLWIYLERIPNTKVTATIRRHLMGTINQVTEAVYTASVLENIDLSTPNLADVTVLENHTV